MTNPARAVTDSLGRLRLRMANLALSELVRDSPLRAAEEPHNVTQDLHAGVLGDLLAPKQRGFNLLAYFVMDSESCLANKRVMYGYSPGLYVIRCNGKDYVQKSGKLFVKKLGSGGRTL